ncbi:alpha/beta fold hydrolase [Paludibacterium purpuratum]|uniref:Pimeloyl-ACP methyl ester carboxylesterase n=1 Tax=Paludibacterium purpuratum TaxID=1144873 RepID=A0A4R7B832_9NEIS|nr:alpha/beta hydrolase [Paludibacterium purpuratum]TDR79935.1 pimeloyl-ACP methyl ester carboxylesterase [Paludibacterium purpuratum]
MQVLKLQHPDAFLRYHDIPGDGVPLMLVHGIGCAGSSDFPRVVTDPALAGRRCLLIDLLGHGYSDKPVDFDYRPASHADTLSTLLDTLALTQIDLFGHSMGGAVAIELARLNPARIRRLVLAEPNLANGGGTFSKHIAGQPLERYLSQGHAELIRVADNSQWAGTMQCASPLAIYRSAEGLITGAEPCWGEQLKALPMPRTVLYGEQTLPDAQYDRLPELGVERGLIANCGHSIPHDQPAALARALAKALA